MIDKLLTDRAVAEITGRARSTLQKDRVAGTGIPFVRVGRLIRYRSADVTAYLEPCRRTARPPNSYRRSEHHLRIISRGGDYAGSVRRFPPAWRYRG
jgi:hypothetical protein